MNEYKIVYIAPPISEIPKVKAVTANNEAEAISIFEMSVPICELVSVQTID